MDNLTFGKRLNLVRKAHGHTSDSLAEACNISPAYLRQIEGQGKMPSMEVLIALCNELEVSPDYLMRDSLGSNEISEIQELTELWTRATPAKQSLAADVLRVILENDAL